MKKRQLETLLYSTIGVTAMLLILVAVNFIAGAFKTRVDLTEEKAYTLSSGTKRILNQLETPVKVRFYWTRSDAATPEALYLNNYAERVDDLLAEYKQVAGSKLAIEKYDPQPDSDAEDSARLDGIEGEMLPSGERFYLGLAVSQVDSRQVVPLPPNRERLLEYDITRAIARVVAPDKPVVGVMSPLPVFGLPSNPMMMRMGQQGQEPWTFITELKTDFEVRPVGMDEDKIDEGIKVLIVIHPKDISDKAQYAIDQFVLRGGKLIAFLDPFSLVDQRSQRNPMFGDSGTGSSLPKLLEAWGLKFESGKVVADLNFKMQTEGQSGQPVDMPTVLNVSREGLNNEDIATSQIGSIWLPFAGAFSGTPADGLKQTVLVKSTPQSQLVDGFLANLSGESVLKEFKSSGVTYTLATRLTGKFKTAFPNGKPEEEKDDAEDAAKKSDEEKADEKTAEKTKDDSLKESKGEGLVVLFGDADLLFDNFTIHKMRTPFGTFIRLLNANLNLAQNLVEQLSGDERLIAMRSRATVSRPFTLIKQIQGEAQENYQSKIRELEARLTETQQRLNELQAQKEKDQRFILSPEQQAEIQKFQKRQAEISTELREVKKKLKRDIVSLENRLKWINIAAMPLAVALSGLVIAIFKKKRTGAK